MEKKSIINNLEILFTRAITWYWSTARVFKLKKDEKLHHYSLAKSKKKRKEPKSGLFEEAGKGYNESPIQPQTFPISNLQPHSSSDHKRDLQQQSKHLEIKYL